jgi:hypothetical protein
MNTIARFVKMLKAHLSDKKDNYLEHDSWLGDTESGFYSQDTFDFDALLKEIDKFSETFKGAQS